MNKEQVFTINVDSEIYLSPPTVSDIPEMVEYLNNEDIYKFTLTIPKPYTTQNAREFIRYTQEISKEYSQDMNWAIRKHSDNKLIGGIGFHCKHSKSSHKEEIGYWLGKPFWGENIMTRVLKKVCEHGFINLGLVRIEAPIFEFNPGSMRVAEKVGFRKEGIAKKSYYKDNRYFDGIMYAIVNETL